MNQIKIKLHEAIIQDYYTYICIELKQFKLFFWINFLVSRTAQKLYT